MNKEEQLKYLKERIRFMDKSEAGLFMNNETQSYMIVSEHHDIKESGFYFYSMGRLFLNEKTKSRYYEEDISKAKHVALGEHDSLYLLTEDEISGFKKYARNAGEEFDIHEVFNIEPYCRDHSILDITIEDDNTISTFEDTATRVIWLD